ncbi:phosphoadenylyl-sulfate reductase [Kyrpidia spormannii]|uniref:Adenosine 5'-phosphosulfate reductase n=2 Tax=Kyrpidia spormannii TaxID=2055160 RepID=A0A2K8N589_9BACL|nr:phosphoadenylyl-sulfate reductase [Kyrpidia spormannii]
MEHVTRVPVMSPEEVGAWAEGLEGCPPEEILEWALERFSPRIALACSFGVEDVVLVDMATRILPHVQIFYLDTGLLFPETYEVRDRVVDRYRPNLRRVTPQLDLRQQAAEYGEALWTRDPNTCCRLRKVEPLRDVLAEQDAWVTGIRREQSPTRAGAKVVEVDRKFGLIKVNPLAGWDSRQVWNYVHTHEVPYNSLHDRGYPSIGCAPCTRPVRPGEDPRAGRWAGFDKTECGLHG